MRFRRNINAMLSPALLFCLVACEQTQQSPTKKTTPGSSGATQKTCEDYAPAECPSACYKYIAAGYTSERCNTAPQPCSSLTSSTCSTGLYGSCTYLSGLQKCIEKFSDTCEARQSVADCTNTYSGTKCLMVVNNCTTLSSCTNIAASSCASTTGCATAQTANGTVCATTEEAGKLNAVYSGATKTNTIGTVLTSILPSVLPGILNIIQTLLAGNVAKNNPNAQVNIGIPASTTPVVQAGTTAPASLGLATFAPLFSQYGIRTANPSTCDKIKDPTECDTKYPECGWLSETCISLTNLTSKEVCTGVGINESGELAANTAAKDRCTLYNRHCALSNSDVACSAKE